MERYIRKYKEKTEKFWEQMSKVEKMKAYKVAIKSKEVDDTFEGFSKMMSKAIFDVNTGKIIEL